MSCLFDDGRFDAELAGLAAADPRIAEVLARTGPPPLRRWPAGFATLVDVIIGQQVSVHASKAIKARLRASVGAIEPEILASASDEALIAGGLSRAKQRYIRGLARMVVDGALDLDGLATQDDETAVSALVAAPGIGRWTAEVYLLFAHGRVDVWPADDLAVQAAAGSVAGLAERPTGKATRAIAEAWAPRRGTAAHLMWHLYHHQTGRAGTGATSGDQA
jgi:DNA-3-methyladenine glycosylase II